MKFESTKSLASTSSRSIGGALSDNGDRDATLQNVLTFLAEQQKYAHQNKDNRPRSVTDVTKDFNIEGISDLFPVLCKYIDLLRFLGPAQHFDEIKNPDSNYSLSKGADNENYVTLKQLCAEYELSGNKKEKRESVNLSDKLSYAKEICEATPLDIEGEICSNISDHPVDICSSVNVELNSLDYQSGLLEQPSEPVVSCDSVATVSDSVIETSISDVSATTCTSESLSSSTTTPETIASKIPRRKTPSRIPVSPARVIINNNNNNKENVQETKILKSKIPHKSGNKPKPKVSAWR